MSIWGYEHRKIKHLSPLAFCLPFWRPHRWLVLFSSSLCDFSESLSLLVLVWLFSFLFFWCDTSFLPFLPSFPCSFLFLWWSNFLWSWYSVFFSAGFCLGRWFLLISHYHLRLSRVNSFTKNGDSTWVMVFIFIFMERFTLQILPVGALTSLSSARQGNSLFRYNCVLTNPVKCACVCTCGSKGFHGINKSDILNTLFQVTCLSTQGTLEHHRGWGTNPRTVDILRSTTSDSPKT